MERQINILIVDDDTGLTSNLQDILEAEGYSTAVANDGQTALALYDKSVFDLALVDFRLPDMSGIDLIKESVGLSPRVEYVIITGFASLDSAIDAVIHRNIVGYLTKPLNMEYLTLLIRQVIERRQAEVALKQSEEKYYSLLDNANDIVQYVGPDARFQFVNKQWLETLGYSAEEVENLKVTDILPENQIARIMKTLQGLADGGTVENIETTFISKYGKEIDVEGSGKGILQDGEFVGAIGIFRDITERKQADEAIKRSKDYLEDLNNSLSEAIVTVNIPNKIQDRVFQYANRSVELIFGYQPEELIGQSPEMQYPSHEEFLSMGRELKHAIKQGEKLIRQERLMKRKNGEIFPAEVTTTFIRTGGEVTQVLSIIRDITEHKQAEEALRQSEENLRAYLESAPDGIYINDLKGTFLYGNKKAEALMGYKREELVGKSFLKLKLLPAKQLAKAGKLLALNAMGRPTGPDEFELLRKDSSRISVEISTTPIKQGERTVVLGFVRDITERKKMEEQLIVTDRLASIGELSSGIAHELNNPLTSVIGFSDLLLGKKDLPDDVKEDLRVVNREARRTAGVVRNLLVFARKHETERKPVDIHGIIKMVLELRAYEQKLQNIKVHTRFASSLPEIIADGFQLQQVFLNIIINAEHFMVKERGRGTLTITTEKAGDIIRASFADDGPGIAKDNLGHLFDPFFTTKEVGKGTGLGLSISYGIVTEHGGRIYAESELGKGATFIVELPISQ